MKRIILSLLFATAAFGQISVQKKQDGSNQISNGPVVVGSNNSITATGTGIIAATAIPSISIITAAPLTGGSALTGNLTLAIPQSSGSVNGYLSSGDWTIFNTKQPAGSYITALTGDGSAAGPGSAVFTLATVLGSPGSVGTATNAPVITFDAKGRATATSTITITPALGSITGLGTGVAAFLATPSSANLAAAVTDETGTGALVFGTSPTLVSPHFGSIVNTGTLTLPTVTDTLIGRATTDVLTNKSISGSTNTLTNIPNSALTNQGITLGTTVVNLGGTITSLAGINSITAASATDLVLNGGATSGNVVINTNGSTLAATFSGANTALAGNLTANGTGPHTLAGTTVITGTGRHTRIRNDAAIIDFTNTAENAFIPASIQASVLSLLDGSGTGFVLNSGNGTLAGNLVVNGAGTTSIASVLTTLGGQLTAITDTNAKLWVRKGRDIGAGEVDAVGLDALDVTLSAQVPIIMRGSAITLEGPTTIASNLTVSGTGTSSFAGPVSVTSSSASSIGSAVGAGSLIIGNAAPSGDVTGQLQFLNSNANTNWRVSNNVVTSGAFEITPSTAGGGTTFTTPAFKLTSTVATFAGNLIVSGTLQLGNAYAAGVTTATGTLDLKDNTGATLHVLVHN